MCVFYDIKLLQIRHVVSNLNMFWGFLSYIAAEFYDD